jgi:hypothetical protein
MARTRRLAGVMLVGAALLGASASRAATVPPACAPVSAAAPSLRTLAERARVDLGAADQVASVHVAAPPRYFWGKTFGPRSYPITRRSPWVYVRLRPLDPKDPASNVTRQRAVWQSALLVQSLHAAVCTAGRRPEAGDSGQTPHGARAFELGGGAVTRLSRLRDWPYARVGPRRRPTAGRATLASTGSGSRRRTRAESHSSRRAGCSRGRPATAATAANGYATGCPIRIPTAEADPGTLTLERPSPHTR